ncbi:MAG: O-antigen ligase family protein [Cyclobacteriaceae bacterium]
MEKALDYSAKILIALLIITIPLLPKWGNYALALLGIVGLAIYARNRTWNRPPAIFFFLIGAYLVRVVWLFRSNDLNYGLRSLETEAPLAAIPLVFCFFSLSEETRKQFLKMYVWTAFILMLLAFVNLTRYIIQSPFGFFEYLTIHLSNKKQMSEANMLNWRFAHPSFLSMFILYAQCIFFFLRPKNTSDKIFLSLFTLSALMFTLLSGSRAGFFLTFFSFLLFAIIEFKSFLRKKIPFFVLAGTIAIGCFFFAKRISDSGFDSFDSLRASTFVKTMQALQQKPVLGYGTGGEREIIRDEHLESIGYTIYHPHNQYLTELLQFGLIGSLPLFLFLALTIHYSIKYQLWDLCCIVIIFAVFMLVEAPINSNKGLVPFMIAILLTGSNGAGRKRYIVTD